MKKGALLITLFIYFITHLNAQSLANLQDTITDNRNNGITGVLIHVLNTNLESTTNADGRFAFNSVPPADIL